MHMDRYQLADRSLISIYLLINIYYSLRNTVLYVYMYV
jgi:hypothetical protein